MKARIREASFKDWLNGQNVLSEETAIVIPE